MRRRRLGPALLLTAALAAVGACGVGAQDRPTPIRVDPTPTASPPRADGDGPRALRVHLVRGERLVAVERRVRDRSSRTALEELLAGPTSLEVASRIRTAVPPQALALPTGRPDADGVVEVAATQDLTRIVGSDQLLAVAQVVWTLSESPGTERVLLTVDGRALDVPTDRGLVRGAVGREDLASVAPQR